jgi:hypothetical protein
LLDVHVIHKIEIVINYVCLNQKIVDLNKMDNKQKNADNNYTSCCAACTDNNSYKKCECKRCTDLDDEETEYNNFVDLLNSEDSKTKIESANLETLMCLRRVLWGVRPIKEASSNLVLERLKVVCPHVNSAEETFEIGYDNMMTCYYCYDCKSAW